MEELELPIERLNKFLSEHTFKVEDPIGEVAPQDMYAIVKVQLTGTKEMVRIGDLTTFITYTTLIQPSGPMMNTLAGLLMRDQKELELDNQDMTFYILNNRVSDQLEKFLLYWGIENPVMCTKVINETSNNVNESKTMSKLNDVTNILVSDILKVVTSTKEGRFILPEWFNQEEMVYTESVINGYTLELVVETSEDVVDFEIDGDLYYDDDLININITINPNMDEETMRDLIGEIIETTRHEVEHINQYDNGLERTQEPKSSEQYYSQDKEIGAQRAGFKMRSTEQNVDFETLVRNWFKKYPHKHELIPEQQERVIQKILSEK